MEPDTPRNSSELVRFPKVPPAQPPFIYGKFSDDVLPGESGDFTVWIKTAGVWGASSRVETAYAPPTMTEGQLDADTLYRADFHVQSQEWHVCVPVIATTEITMMTNFQVDDANQKLQKKTRTAKVLDPGSESGWTDIYTGTTCP